MKINRGQIKSLFKVMKYLPEDGVNNLRSAESCFGSILREREQLWQKRERSLWQ